MIVWTPGLAFTLNANAIKDFSFNLANWLAGETIATALAAATGCTASVVNTTATTVKVRVAEAGANAAMSLTVVTSSGQSDTFTTYFNPEPSTCCA